MPAAAQDNPPKRSLIVAGGAMKVGFQAGVLQVWLDEADLTFDHADGASGGVFNLAMLCQGMSGKEIADAWRRTDPVAAIDINAAELAKLAWARSLFTLDAIRERLFSTWGLDFEKIRASPLDATFNSYNFTHHEQVVWPPSVMTAERLCACVSLPMWFPPVVLDGDTYIDGVFLTDANLEEAIRRGADEIWVIWTVSEKAEWHDGFVANYFQIIETCANGNFRKIVKRIEASNAAIAAGESGEFGRHIELKILRAEVPIHYLVAFSKDRLTETVNLGVEHARRWCAQHDIPLKRTTGEYPTDVHEAYTELEFTEIMKGYVAAEEAEYRSGYDEGKAQGSALKFQLTIKVEGVNRFLVNPRHEATASGWVEGDFIGGRSTVEQGGFNLFVDAEDPARKFMYYRLFIRDSNGRPLTLVGFKDVKDDEGGDVWSDTTTLYVRLLEGFRSEDEDGGAAIVAAGVLHIEMLDFLHQLTTFRTRGPTLADRTAAMSRFGRLFMGKLWDVYAGHLLTYAPL